MKHAAPRAMTFNVRPIESETSDTRWHWSVYDNPHGHFIRNGQITGDHEKAVRAAKAAILLMGGTAQETEGSW